MHKIEISGSYYEMGKINGGIHKQGGFKPEELTEASKNRIEFADKCEKIVQQYCPGLIDYLKGFADGGNYDFNRIKLFPLVLGYGIPLAPNCSVCYVSSEFSSTSHPILFRNYDFKDFCENYASHFHLTPTDGFESHSFSDLWIGSHGGFNKEHLMVAITSAPHYVGEWKPGISMALLTQWILDQFDSTLEAAEFLKSVPHMASFNFIIVDKNKNIARVIGTPEKVGVEIYNDQNIIQTNHFLIDNMKHLEDSADISESSIQRLENIGSFLERNKGKINHQKIEKLCKAFIRDGGIFEDGVYSGIKNISLWSWHYDFETQEFKVTNGNPRDNQYELITFN